MMLVVSQSGSQQSNAVLVVLVVVVVKRMVEWEHGGYMCFRRGGSTWYPIGI